MRPLLRQRRALVLAVVAAGSLAACQNTTVLGAAVARSAPRFTIASPRPARGLALTLPYGPAAWEVSTLGHDALTARTVAGATVMDGAAPRPVPTMACTFGVAPEGQSVEQAAAAFHPDVPRYNPREVSQPAARLFTVALPVDGGPDRRVGIVALPTGRVAVGNCALLAGGGSTMPGAEAFAFYDEVLLGVTDAPDHVATAQARLEVDGAAALAERHAVLLAGPGFHEGMTLGLPGNPALWTLDRHLGGFGATADRARLGTALRCEVGRLPGREMAVVLSHAARDASGAARGVSLSDRREVTVGERQGLSSSWLDPRTGEDTVAWVAPLSDGLLRIVCTAVGLDAVRTQFDLALASSVLAPSPRVGPLQAPAPAPIEPLAPTPSTPAESPAAPAQVLEIPAPAPRPEGETRRPRRRRPRRGRSGRRRH